MLVYALIEGRERNRGMWVCAELADFEDPFIRRKVGGC